MSESRSHTVLSAAADRAQPGPHALRPDDIHRQLERILGSGQFRDSLRLTRFLTFVVETALGGKSETIKAYAIAVEALGRGPEFDPQNDPIVRVEARRLRQALTRYYAEAGRDDPLVIDLPRGTYVPVFRRSGAKVADQPRSIGAAPSPVVAPTARLRDLLARRHESEILRDTAERQTTELNAEIEITRRAVNGSQELLGQPNQAAIVSPRGPPPMPATGPRRILRYGIYLISILSALAVGFDIAHSMIGGNAGLFAKLWPQLRNKAAPAQSNERAPTLYVEPVATVGAATPGTFSPTMIRERMLDALARFDDVTVVDAAPQSAQPSSASASKPGDMAASIYRVSATVRYHPEGAASLLVQLIDTADGTVAWSKTYEQPSEPDPNRIIGSDVGDMALSLLGSFGVIQARERVKRAAANPMQDTYRCILDANFYLRSFDPSQYQPVRDCLVRASAEDPPAASVFVDLAFLHLRAYRLGIFEQPGDRSMLDDAYRMAARAVDIKPTSALAQLALQEVLLAKGDIARAKIAGDNSFRLNPNDSAVVFGHASLLILTDRIDQGIALLTRNTAKAPNSWIGYHMLMALGCYLKGDLKTAAVEAGQIASPLLPPGLVLDAIVANKAGDRSRAQADIAMLYQFYPAWHENFRASVARFLPDPGMADRIAADFESAAAGITQ